MTKAVIFIYTRSFNEPGVDSIDRYEVDDYILIKSKSWHVIVMNSGLT